MCSYPLSLSYTTWPTFTISVQYCVTILFTVLTSTSLLQHTLQSPQISVLPRMTKTVTTTSLLLIRIRKVSDSVLFPKACYPDQSFRGLFHSPHTSADNNSLKYSTPFPLHHSKSSYISMLYNLSSSESVIK